MLRRLLVLVLLVIGVVGAWLLVLGWRATKHPGADGYEHGPYTTGQVAVFVGALILLTAAATVVGGRAVTIVGLTLAVTLMFSADASGTDHSGLWLVGASMVLVGTFAGSALVVSLVAAVLGRTPAGLPSARP